jgi:hypothetical protein
MKYVSVMLFPEYFKRTFERPLEKSRISKRQ